MSGSIIIIGAGLAGLATGCYAQMNGFQSQIFEHHTAAGGVAASWVRKNYLIDGGFQLVTGHKAGTALNRIYRELGIQDTCVFADLPSLGRFVDLESGRKLEITADLESLGEELGMLFPSDHGKIEHLLSSARRLQGLDLSHIGLKRPAELYNNLDHIKFGWRFRRILHEFSGTNASSIRSYARVIHEPWLKHILETLYVPDAPVWFLVLLLALHADDQLALLDGGCSTFVQPLVERYKNLGGNVNYASTVEGILVEKGKATGIQLSDGSQHHADTVISAGDSYNTVLRLLSGRYMDESVKRRFRNSEIIRPQVITSLGVVSSFQGEPWLSTIKLPQPLVTGKSSADYMRLRIYNHSRKFSPPGKTVLQVRFESDWDHWNELRRDHRLYQTEKEKVASEVLSRIEGVYPGISPLVEMVDVATPFTTWRHTMNHHGAYMGWMPTPEILKQSLPRTLPGLSSFYMAGQWVMPGGTVPSALYSGRQAVRLLCKDENKRFSTRYD